MDKKIFMISEVFTYKILHKNLLSCPIPSAPRAPNVSICSMTWY